MSSSLMKAPCAGKNANRSEFFLRWGKDEVVKGFLTRTVATPQKFLPESVRNAPARRPTYKIWDNAGNS